MPRALILLVVAALLAAALPAEAQRARGRRRAPVAAPQPAKRDTLPPPAALAAVDSAEYRFGTAEQGQMVRHTFRIRNTGQADLRILQAKPSCGCTVGAYPTSPVAPGDAAEVQVQFNTAGKLGPQNKTVTLTTNGTPQTLQLRLVGEVVSPSVPIVPVAGAEPAVRNQPDVPRSND